MIGILGGTFNPVHWGHLRTALEVKNSLALDKMLLIPCRIPPHREEPDVRPEIRLAMLKAALSECGGRAVDERALKRAGPSYTVDTLNSRHQEDPGISIALTMGVDAFIHLDSWHEWRRLFDLAHIIIVHRPGWLLSELTEHLKDELHSEVGSKIVTDVKLLEGTAKGLVLPLKVTNIDISSSEIRRRISQGYSVETMVPKGVLGIIQREKLYRGTNL